MISLTAIAVVLLLGWLARRAWIALARTFGRRRSHARVAAPAALATDTEQQHTA